MVSENLILNPSHNPFSIPSLFLSTRGREGIRKEEFLSLRLLGNWILLQRLIPVLEDLGVPYYTQTDHAGISCADPTEVIQGIVRSHLQHGSTAYQGFYDLEKAFDSVEYYVLLDYL